MENLVKLGRSDPHDSGLLVDHTLGEHIHSHLKGSKACTLAYAALEHPELALLDCEFNVLHIVEVAFERLAYLVKLLVDFRHCGLERLEILVVLVLGGFIERVRSTDTCNHILALGVDEPLSVELVVTVGRVAGECHTGSGGAAHISEYHGLHVHCSTPVIRNLLDAAVCDGTLSVPGLEHASD